MRIEIERLLSADGLSRDAWEFDFNDREIRLLKIAHQTRETQRKKWTGDIWDWMDERNYHSRLQKPKTIPADVLAEAREKFIEMVAKVPIYIGHRNIDCLYVEEE